MRHAAGHFPLTRGERFRLFSSQKLGGGVTKHDLIEAIAAETGLPKNQILNVIETAFDRIIQSLARGERVEFRNFGVFAARMRKPRKAHNPKTRAEINIPAKRAVSFKPGKEMKARVG